MNSNISRRLRGLFNENAEIGRVNPPAGGAARGESCLKKPAVPVFLWLFVSFLRRSE